MNFNNLSLRVKLIGGFFTVLVLLGAVAIISFIALNGSSTGFMEYREMARDANLTGELETNMLMARMNVKNFIIKGSQTSQNQYEVDFEKMDEILKKARKEITAPDRAKKINEIAALHLQYNDHFHRVVELKKKNNELLANIFTVKGPEAEKALISIMTSAEKDNDALVSSQTGIALRFLLLTRLSTQKYLTTNEQSEADMVMKDLVLLKNQLDVMENTLTKTAWKEWLTQARSTIEEYGKSFEILVQIITESNQIILEGLDKIGPEIASIANQIHLSIKKNQDKIGPRLQASNTRAVILILISTIGALATGFFLVFFITRSVLNQLGGDPSQIALLVRRIADGNLAMAPKNGKSTGVYHDMEIMTDNLKKMVTDIITGVETLTVSATELSAISTQMSQGAKETSGKSASVASASEEMSTNMNSVAASMEETTTNVSMVAAAAEEMSSTVGEIAKNAENANRITGNAATKTHDVSTRLDELGKSANEIGKVVETITDISEQVNLLALNATIEAARAGEAGKGFAVVANEIKDLARQTAAATGQIKASIQGVQTSTDATVKEIQEITTVITDSNDMVSTIAAAVEEQTATTIEIAENTNQVAAGLSEISENVNQSSVAANTISQDIAEINGLSEEFTTSSNQVQKRAGELTELAASLQEMVGRFSITAMP